MATGEPQRDNYTLLGLLVAAASALIVGGCAVGLLVAGGVFR